MMYPHPYPLHILILNILGILKKGLSFVYYPYHPFVVKICPRNSRTPTSIGYMTLNDTPYLMYI